MKKSDNKLIVGLDIGTSKVLAIVAEVDDENILNIIGVGHHPAKGLRRGVVADIESTVLSIKRAVEEAELMADCEIMSVYVGIAGAHINSFNSHGVVAIRDGEVTRDDVNRVLEAAQAMVIPNDQQILHVLPQEFVIDGQDEIKQPLGMCGVRLEAKVHLITGAVSAAQNIVKCIKRCGLEV
ncbi:MAG: cell division protein FtsA, partial [Arenicellales bacterium]